MRLDRRRPKSLVRCAALDSSPMLRLSCAALILALALLWAAGARAQTPAETPTQAAVQTPAAGDSAALAALEGYIRQAVENNPDIKGSYSAWKAGMEKVPQAGVLPDPRFTYGYYFQPVETRTGPQRMRYGLAQTMPWFGKLSTKEKQTALEADALVSRMEAQKVKVIGQVKDAYYEYAYLAQAIAITRENADLLAYLEQVAEARYRAGLADYSQIVRLGVEQGKLEDRLRSLEDLKKPVQARLNAAMSRPSEDNIPLPLEIPVMVSALTDKEVMAGIEESNPDLKALEVMTTAAQAGVDFANKGYYPDFTFGMELIQQDRARQGSPVNNGDNPLVGTVSINLPIWVEARNAAVREAEHKKQGYREQWFAGRDRLGAAMQLALYKYRDAGRKIDLYQTSLIPKAEQGLGAALQSFQTGGASALDLVDAQRTLLEFQLSALRALADQGQRMAEMETILGREIPCKVHCVRLAAPTPDGLNGKNPAPKTSNQGKTQ